MHYLIDGHNLIGKMPDISLADPNDEMKLVLRLKSWASAGRKRRVTVVFDGGLPGGHSVQFSSSVVKVLFASIGNTADALLLRRIRNVKNPLQYMVVSSDQEIIAAANARRMPCLRSEEFVAELVQERRHAGSTSQQEVPSGKPIEPVINAEELEEWLELFGPTDQPPSSESMPNEEVSPVNKSTTQVKSDGRKGLKISKESNEKLSAAEVEDWLRVFENDDD